MRSLRVYSCQEMRRSKKNRVGLGRKTREAPHENIGATRVYVDIFSEKKDRTSVLQSTFLKIKFNLLMEILGISVSSHENNRYSSPIIFQDHSLKIHPR